MEAYMLLLLIAFSFFISYFPLSLSQPDKEYNECRPSLCGIVGKIEYPFWSEEIGRPSYCGRSPAFKLKCPQQVDQYPSIQIDSHTFNVTHIDPSAPKMTLLPTDFVYNNCSSHFTTTSVSIGPNIFHYDNSSSVKNVTLFYGCPIDTDNAISGFKLPCLPGTAFNSNSNIYAFYSEDDLLSDILDYCTHQLEVPVSIETYGNLRHHSQDLEDALLKGLVVRYEFDEYCKECSESEGHPSNSFGVRLFICFSRFFMISELPFTT